MAQNQEISPTIDAASVIYTSEKDYLDQAIAEEGQ
jgi:hypothetical protein